MRKIKFIKMVASGNDFVVIPCLSGRPRQRRGRQELYGYANNRLAKLTRSICDRKFGVGADGLLVLAKSKAVDIKMRVFNSDGSEANMCGNGARCVARYIGKNKISIETKAGIIQAAVNKESVKIKLTDPRKLRLSMLLDLPYRCLNVNYIDTGVPHVVIFTAGLGNINVPEIGRLIRYHKRFLPQGTNVNFIEALGDKLIAVRTYERGVEDETLACGTGSVASALIFALLADLNKEVKVKTKSGEILKVYFNKDKNNFFDVWLEGRAKMVYKGEYNV